MINYCGNKNKDYKGIKIVYFLYAGVYLRYISVFRKNINTRYSNLKLVMNSKIPDCLEKWGSDSSNIHKSDRIAILLITKKIWDLFKKFGI
ncbi:MAG: hypothetical protein EAZ77_08260 [Nostocales cyanobacterium]|nr:MAG: hypothetical protein EAZ77_08260 [Nostocales cyanobacterium]